MLHYRDLETKFGAAAAYAFLLEIEKVARIASWQRIAMDPEARLADALRAQDRLVAESRQAA
jgi:cytochrome c551/c552